MTTGRKSYNQCHAEWVARMRAENPELAALWGATDVTGSAEADVRETFARQYAEEAAAGADDGEDCTDLG